MDVLTLLRHAFGVTRMTSSVSRHPALAFEEEYPVSLPGRLEFLEDYMGLPRERILRLAGAPPAFAEDPAVGEQSWDVLLAQQAPEHRERLAAAEALLADYVTHSGEGAHGPICGWEFATESDEALLLLLKDARGEHAFEILSAFVNRGQSRSHEKKNPSATMT